MKREVFKMVTVEILTGDFIGYFGIINGYTENGLAIIEIPFENEGGEIQSELDFLKSNEYKIIEY